MSFLTPNLLIFIPVLLGVEANEQVAAWVLGPTHHIKLACYSVDEWTARLIKKLLDGWLDLESNS